MAEKSAGGVTASKGVGDRLAVGDELPSVLARQSASSQECQEILETEHKSGIKTAMPAASAENNIPSKALVTLQLLGDKNVTGQ